MEKSNLLLYFFFLLAPLHALALESNDISEITAAMQSMTQKINSLQSAFNESTNELLANYTRTLEEEEEEQWSSFWEYLREKLETRLEDFNNTVFTKLSYLESNLNTTNAKWKQYKEKVYKETANTNQEGNNIISTPGQCHLTRESHLLFRNLPFIFREDLHRKWKIHQKDIAFGKPTYASRYYSSVYLSEHAVDNDEMSSYISARLLNPWWMVDFQEERSINKIIILTRQDCCSNRFRLVEIRLGHDLKLDGNFGSYQLLHFFQGPYKQGQGVLECSFNPEVKGRFLSIQILDREYLQLDTVIVLSSQ